MGYFYAITVFNDPMKRIVFVRHAKSSWTDETLNDMERPLNERGKVDAPLMADKMRSMGLVPDALVSSPARRARKTAQKFAKVYRFEPEIILDDRIYEADEEMLMNVIRDFPPQAETVFVFGHNPGFTWFVNGLCNVRIDNIPTCGCAVVELASDTWKNTSNDNNKLIAFEYPKKELLG